MGEQSEEKFGGTVETPPGCELPAHDLGRLHRLGARGDEEALIEEKMQANEIARFGIEVATHVDEASRGYAIELIDHLVARDIGQKVESERRHFAGSLEPFETAPIGQVEVDPQPFA